MIGDIVEFEDLKRLSGFERRADVERWALRVGLQVRPCRNGVWTTVEAMDRALGGYANPTSPSSYPPEVI